MKQNGEKIDGVPWGEMAQGGVCWSRVTRVEWTRIWWNCMALNGFVSFNSCVAYKSRMSRAIELNGIALVTAVALSGRKIK